MISSGSTKRKTKFPYHFSSSPALGFVFRTGDGARLTKLTSSRRCSQRAVNEGCTSHDGAGATGQGLGAAGGDEPDAASTRARPDPRAHRLLADVYGWFTEGLATADLRSARALLHGLA